MPLSSSPGSLDIHRRTLDSFQSLYHGGIPPFIILTLSLRLQSLAEVMRRDVTPRIALIFLRGTTLFPLLGIPRHIY